MAPFRYRNVKLTSLLPVRETPEGSYTKAPLPHIFPVLSHQSAPFEVQELWQFQQASFQAVRPDPPRAYATCDTRLDLRASCRRRQRCAHLRQ